LSHNLKIVCYAEKILIEGLNPGQNIKIYTLNGYKVYSGYAKFEKESIMLQRKGIFIVNIDGFTEKIIL
jgi:hypothetical protein